MAMDKEEGKKETVFSKSDLQQITMAQISKSFIYSILFLLGT
jgi:hypothetical protein